MEEEVRKRLIAIEDYLSCAEADMIYAKQELDYLYDELQEKSQREIKSIENFKTKLRQEGLYTIELEEFIQNYLKFYNK